MLEPKGPGRSASTRPRAPPSGEHPWSSCCTLGFRGVEETAERPVYVALGPPRPRRAFLGALPLRCDGADVNPVGAAQGRRRAVLRIHTLGWASLGAGARSHPSRGVGRVGAPGAQREGSVPRVLARRVLCNLPQQSPTTLLPSAFVREGFGPGSTPPAQAGGSGPRAWSPLHTSAGASRGGAGPPLRVDLDLPAAGNPGVPGLAGPQRRSGGPRSVHSSSGTATPGPLACGRRQPYLCEGDPGPRGD